MNPMTGQMVLLVTTERRTRPPSTTGIAKKMSVIRVEDRVAHSAEEPGEPAEHRAEDRDAEGGADADADRHAGPGHHPCVDVAALPVEPEGMSRLRALLGLGEVALEGVLGGDQRGPQGDDDRGRG